MIRVALVGSECTGKTALAGRLASHYRTLWLPESSRAYQEAKGEALTAFDVEEIASHHLDLVDRAARLSPGLLILDTDLVSTVVYSNHYYGSCPPWIERATVAHLADLYLLHHPDVPWEADGIRDRGDQREELHAQFQGALESLSARYVDIRGSWDDRFRTAVTSIDELVRS